MAFPPVSSTANASGPTDRYVGSVAELKKIIDAMLDHLILDQGVTTVQLSDAEDFFWSIDQRDLYNMKSRPPELNVGRLSDDWTFLLGMGDNRQEAVSYMLVHAAPLLRYIAEKIGR